MISFFGNSAFLGIIVASIMYPLFPKPLFPMEDIKITTGSKLTSHDAEIVPRKGTTVGFYLTSLIRSTVKLEDIADNSTDNKENVNVSRIIGSRTSEVILKPYFFGFCLGSVILVPFIIYLYYHASMDEDIEVQRKLQESEDLQKLIELWIEPRKSRCQFKEASAKED